MVLGEYDMVCKAVEEYGNERELVAKFEMIKNLMDSMKISAQQAMDALRIPASEQALYLAKLK